MQEVRFGDGTIAISLDPGKLASALQIPQNSVTQQTLSLQLPFHQRRRGVETRLVIGATQPARDNILIANIARAEQ